MLLLLLTTWIADAMPRMPEWQANPNPMDRSIQDACFPSGLRVTFREDHRQPIVSVSTVIDAGAFADPPGKEGLAKVMEHLWFMATLPSGVEVTTRLQDAGARFDATTIGDATVYLTEAPIDALPKLLEVEDHRLSDPLAGLGPDDLAEAKAEVLADLEGLGDLSMQDWVLLMAPGFLPKGIPQAATPMTPESIAAITWADVEQIVGRVYTPQTASLYVAGDLLAPDALTTLQETMSQDVLFVAADGTRPETGTCGIRPRKQLEAPPAPRPEAPLAAVHAPVDDPTLVVAWATPPTYGAMRPTMELAAWFFARRLEEDLVGKSIRRKDLYEPRCDLSPGTSASSLVCRIRIPEGTDPAKLYEVVRNGFYDTGWTWGTEKAALREQQVFRTIDMTLAIADFSALRSQDAANDALANHFYGKPLWYVEALQAYNTYTYEAFIQFVSAWFTKEQMAAKVVVPPRLPLADVMGATGKPDLGPGEGMRLSFQELEVLGDTPTGHEDRAVSTGRPAAADVTAPALAPVTEKVLPNGLRIWVLPYGDFPIVQAAVVALDPSIREPHHGIALWAWDLSFWQRGGLPSGGFTQSAASVAARIRSKATPDWQVLSLEGSEGNLEHYLWLLRRLAQGIYVGPGMNEARERRFFAEDVITALKSQPDAVAHDHRYAQVFGEEHPIGWPRWELLLEGSKAIATDIPKQVQRDWQPEHTAVVIVGGVDPTEAVAYAEAMFKDWKPAKKVDDKRPADLVTIEGAESFRLEVPAPGAQFASIELTCKPGGDDDAVAAVSKEALRIALWHALQGADIPAAEPWVASHTYRGDEALEMQLVVPPDHRARAEQVLLKALGNLTTPVAASPWVDTAASLTARQHVLEFLDRDQVFFSLLDHGPELSTWAKDFPARALAVTPKEVTAWLGGCTDRWAMTITSPDIEGVPTMRKRKRGR